MKWAPGVLVLCALFLALPAFAQGADDDDLPAEKPAATAPPVEGVSYGLIAIGAGLAVGLGGLATGLAQSRIGAAGCGAIASNDKLSGFIFLLVALPETIVLFGFVIAFLLLSKIPDLPL